MTHAIFRTTCLLAFASIMFGGCGGGGGVWPFRGPSTGEPNRLPAGATEYACASGKRLVLRHAADGKSIWVIHPDREFRLDRVATGPGERYSNGVSTLTVSAEDLALDTEGARQFAECKRARS